MTQPESFKKTFPNMAAAQEAAAQVQPGNELQQLAAADIIGLAFRAEVRKAFPNAGDIQTD